MIHVTYLLSCMAYITLPKRNSTQRIQHAGAYWLASCVYQSEGTMGQFFYSRIVTNSYNQYHNNKAPEIRICMVVLVYKPFWQVTIVLKKVNLKRKRSV